jgi:hypothetical protein
MSAFLFGFEPRYRAISATGAPIPGAILRFSVSPGTTPTDPYTTSALTTPVSTTQGAGSAEADSGGLFPAIYLDSEITYRVRLFTSAGVLVWDQDVYEGLNLTQAAVGLVLYPLVPGGPEDSAGVTPTNYAYPPGHLLRYGTNTTPGTTDMSAALQSALNIGEAVYIPEGNFRIATACQMTTTHQRIYGDGQQSILLTTTNIETLYSSTSVFGVEISGIKFNNTVSEAVTGPTEFHVHFGTGASGCKIMDCEFNTALTGAQVRITHHGGVWFEGANLNEILDCRFQQSHILMGSTDATIRGGFIYSFSHQYAIKIVSAGDVVVDAVRGILGGVDKGCIWIPDPSYMNKIVNNYFGGSLSTINIGKGILADQQQMLQVLGNTFHEVDGIGVHLTNPNSGNVISGNSFWAGHPKQEDVLAGVQITGVAGQFSCTATTLTVDSTITISGTYGGTGSITGYSNPTTYYIIATNGTTTFTLSATLGGGAITTTAGTPTGLTYASSSIPGNQDIYIESTSFGASATVITHNVCNRFNGPIEDGMPGLGKSNAIEFNTYSGTANNVIRNNSVSGARYYSPSIVDENPADSVGDNAGTTFSLSWTPSDVSGASLSFASVDCKYVKDADKVTVWGTLTFPATANGSSATIGGLPFAPLAGMAGGANSVITDSSAAQKVRLVPGQTYFFLTDNVDAAQTNATCSGKYFRFTATYLI